MTTWSVDTEIYFIKIESSLVEAETQEEASTRMEQHYRGVFQIRLQDAGGHLGVTTREVSNYDEIQAARIQRIDEHRRRYAEG